MLSFVENGDPRAALYLNPQIQYRHDLLTALLSSTASLKMITAYINTSDHKLPVTAPPMSGVFEPLRNRIIDLAALDRIWKRRLRRSLEAADREERSHESPHITAAMSDDKEHRISPSSIPARPWLRLTTNDEFVSRLVDLFFSYLNVYWRCIEENPFLEAMRSESVRSDFCSPLLVNAMCAYASVC